MSFDLQAHSVTGRTPWLRSKIGSLQSRSTPQGFIGSSCRFSGFPSAGLDVLYLDECVKFMAVAVFLDKRFVTKEDIAVVSQISLTQLQRANI